MKPKTIRIRTEEMKELPLGEILAFVESRPDEIFDLGDMTE